MKKKLERSMLAINVPTLLRRDKISTCLSFDVAGIFFILIISNDRCERLRYHLVAPRLYVFSYVP